VGTHPAHDCWAAERWPRRGILVAPGELYGPAGARHIRVALTATDERIDDGAADHAIREAYAKGVPAVVPGVGL
jgi:aspartate/methionine/tyrosine aminotransferase